MGYFVFYICKFICLTALSDYCTCIYSSLFTCESLSTCNIWFSFCVRILCCLGDQRCSRTLAGGCNGI
uniref:Secreted protein n=1 Tax=Rhizophora mucronata TaxID=61149 RepID=A0A2P2QSP6_RHIMU